MDHQKTGTLIRQLRREQGLTQLQLADRLGVSDRTISKWERGLGCPDVSLWADLSAILCVDLERLLSGDGSTNHTIGGNMKHTKFFVCPICGSIVTSTGNATISCCGRPLSALEPQKAAESDKLRCEQVEDEWLITTDHPAEKHNYISFVAFATGDTLQILKQYPEWEMNARIPRRRHGRLLWYSTTKGLFYQLI
ncbi:MAG: helix-turn-helix domain-containing protein [Oscillospiraceae bacterium]|nr:helix-turn-helix domain-containing protein [Oscillospiraceae bacterium]